MKIFIKNFPFEVEEEELRAVFGDFGKVKSLRIIKDKETGQSRGFGFVEMENDEEAKQAINSMNGGDYNGRKILVQEAQENEGGNNNSQRNKGFNRGSGGGNFNRGGGSREGGFRSR